MRAIGELLSSPPLRLVASYAVMSSPNPLRVWRAELSLDCQTTVLPSYSLIIPSQMWFGVVKGYESRTDVEMKFSRAYCGLIICAISMTTMVLCSPCYTFYILCAEAGVAWPLHECGSLSLKAATWAR